MSAEDMKLGRSLLEEEFIKKNPVGGCGGY